jgi:catechol 2,3-dioxygenase-like lactoylglutathione lyase family enzyme
MTQGTATHITEIGTVIVAVSDQDRAIEFYVDKLGFEKRLDVPFGPGDRWVEVAPKEAITTIALVSPHEGPTTGITVSFSTADAEATHRELKTRGVDVDEILRFGGPVPPMFIFRDPDGTEFRMVQRG